MTPRELNALVEYAQNPGIWAFSDDVLYRLCRKYPLHTDPSIAAAKILLIGRAYAAAIERRKPTEANSSNYYQENVVPAVIGSEIDSRLDCVKEFRKITQKSFPKIIETHKYVTGLFEQISGQQNDHSLRSIFTFIVQSFFISSIRSL